MGVPAFVRQYRVDNSINRVSSSPRKGLSSCRLLRGNLHDLFDPHISRGEPRPGDRRAEYGRNPDYDLSPAEFKALPPMYGLWDLRANNGAQGDALFR